MSNRFRCSRSRLLLLSLLLLLGSVGQLSGAELAPRVGTFLVASENMADPRFRQSVVLLVQHDADGSGGVIVNRPSRLPLSAVIESGEFLSGNLFYGGPVEPQALLVLARTPGEVPQPAVRILDQVYLTGVTELLDWLGQRPKAPEYRVFTGYAGWAAGQLANEMTRGDWRVLPADAESLFQGDVAELWQRLREVRVL